MLHSTCFVTSYNIYCCILHCLLDPENNSTLPKKLRLPAPASAVSKHTAEPTTSTAVDGDGDNTQSSLLAGMLFCLL